jgi:integrase
VRVNAFPALANPVQGLLHFRSLHRKEDTLSGHVYCRDLRGSNQQRWYAVIDVAPPGAPRKQLTRAFPTRREARAWAAQIAAHRHTRTNGPLVGEYLQSWLAGRAAIRASTATSYRAHIEKHLMPLLGDELLAALRPGHIQRAHHQLLADGMTPATLTRVHATLSAALNTASRQGLLTGNPLAGVELPRVDRMEPTIWTLEEARTFLKAIRGDEFEALWRLALVTGIRRGELLGLAWDDVDQRIPQGCWSLPAGRRS